MPDISPTSADLFGVRVLVIQGDQDNLDLFAIFLRQCGAHVATAQAAKEALEYLNGQRIDAILTDLSVLKGVSSTEFVSEVRSRPQYKSIPVIAVTGWSQKDEVCRDTGFSAFLQKPVDLDYLTTTIRSLVAVQ